MNNKNAEYYFLKGGGEMGELIRAKDWSKTALGDPSHWPQSLCTMVAVMLDNPFGMYIAWGSEYTQLYNNGYRPILGSTKHPQALGISTRETFSEIWQIIESMFEGVMKGNAVGFPDLMLPLNRNGFVEECYFDFAYSPIRKDNGEVGGVLVTVIETTEKKRAQAELIESTEQLKFAMEAAELGTWDYDPASNKFTANNRLKAWFGLPESEEIELHHATDAIAEKDRDRIIMAIKKVLDYSSGGIYEEEYSIINPLTNKEIIVQGKGRAWFNEEKIAYRFNGILQEVTENVLARKRIEDNEEQLRIAIEGGEFGTFDFFPQTNKLIWSDKTKELFGLNTDAQVNYETYLGALHPEDRDTSKAIAQQRADLKEGGLYELDYRVIGISDGKLRWLRSKGKATYNDEGEPIRYTGVIQDITKQKEAAEVLRQSNKRFMDTVRQAPVGICILRGPQYIVEIANDAYLQLVDKKETEFVGNPLFGTLPEVEEAVHALLDNVLNTGIPYHGNEVAIPVNRYGKQDVFYFDFLYHPLKEEDGKISGVIAIVTDVSEKVKTRKTIEERKRLYEAITQNTPDLIYVFGLNYRFTYANEALLKMWGRTWDDSIGKSMLEIGYEPWHAEMHIREIEQVIATKKPIRGEVSFPHATLGKRIYDYIFAPVISQDGNVEAIAGTTRDITPQVEAWKQIEESEQNIRSLVLQSPIGICVIDADTLVSEIVNDSFIEIAGKPLQEISGKHYWDTFAEARPYYESALNKVIEEGKSFYANEAEMMLIRHGKEEMIYVTFVYAPLKNIDGIVKKVVVWVIDNTLQVIVRRKIAESEERFRSLAQTLPQLVWVTDAQGKSEFASFRWKEYSGIEPSGEKEWKAIVHPDDYDNINAAWVDSLNTGNIYAFDVRLKSKEGEYRWHTVRGEPVLDKENKIIKWVGAFTDIHDQKIREEKKDEFISIASHEMKTPLTTAKAYLQMLELFLDESDGDASLYAKKANQSVNRLNELISELLDVSKIRLGKLNYTLTTFNFNEMIDSTVENIQLTSTTHTIIKSGKVDLEVTGDKDRLQQVVINLLTNAIKYSPGSEKVFLNIEEENGSITVSVKDTGIGIAPQSLNKIFEKYHRVEEHAVHFQGLGIGLFISYEIIQRHYGKLWAESEPGKGSTFYFTIPAGSILSH